MDDGNIGGLGGSVRNAGLRGVSVDIAVPEVESTIAAKAVSVVVSAGFFDGKGALVFVFVFAGFWGITGVVASVGPDPVVVGGGIGAFGSVADLSDDANAAFAGACDVLFPDTPVDGGAGVARDGSGDGGSDGGIGDAFGPLDDAPTDGFGETRVGEALGEGCALSAVRGDHIHSSDGSGRYGGFGFRFGDDVDRGSVVVAEFDGHS